MQFCPTRIPGVYVVELERKQDERGFFARSYCEREFAELGLVTRFVQCNVSFNARRGTLRGMHLQLGPSPEIKLVRCTGGAAMDVVVDLRPNSPTYCQWERFELSAENRRAVYVPAGIAHGFQALVDDTELFYQMSEFYNPALAAGVRWNDPAFGIEWPLSNPILSERDRTYANFDRTKGTGT